jgi:hypothetical protein
MSQPEQWRFQWPDGTWIRWNPQTQSWEKEAPGDDGDAEVLEATPPPREAVARSEPEVVPDAQPDPDPVAETHPEQEFFETPEPATAVWDTATEPDEEEPAHEPMISRRDRRSMVGDVLPPAAEPDGPTSSLWPTVVTGMVVGLGVGLFLWNMIR